MLVTYYFNGHSSSQWTDPANLNDGSLITFAKAINDSYSHNHNSNTCPGTVLGVISKVEMRVYGYMDIANGAINIKPVFTGGQGDDHLAYLGTSAEWSSWFDITDDTNAPTPWGWSDVQSLDNNVIYHPSMSDWKYAAKVEIRVTYDVVTFSRLPKPIRGTQSNKTHPHISGLIFDGLLNEGTGAIVADLSRHGNHGILQGTSPSWSAGGISLPGNNEYISLSHLRLIDWMNDFNSCDKTISIWVTFRSLEAVEYNALFYLYHSAGKQPRIALYAYQDKLIWRVRDDGGGESFVESASAVVINTLYNIVGTWKQSENRCNLYLNGVYIGTDTGASGTISNFNSSDYPAIGAARENGSLMNYANIRLELFSLYNRALSVPEINARCREPFRRFERPVSPGLLFGGVDVTITSATLTTVATLYAPTITTTRNVTVTPSTLTIAATLHAPTITTTRNVTVTPSTLTVAATLHAPTVTAIRNVTVTPDTLQIAATLYAPTIIIAEVGVTVYPALLEIKATLHTPYLVIPYIEIPPFMQKDMIDPYGGGAWLWLVEIDVPGLPSGSVPTRIARNTEDVHYGEYDYDKFNLQIGEQIFSGDGSIPRVTLRIFQDINRRIEDIINETEGALGAAVKLIRVNEKFLDTPVAALEQNYSALAAESDSEWVTFTLGIPNPLMQRFPLYEFSSSICSEACPELFKGAKCQYSGADITCAGTYDACCEKNNAEHWGGELGLDPNVVRI